MLTKELLEFSLSKSPDDVLMRHIGQMTLPDNTSQWSAGQPLRLLLAGYLGAGNIGSEMRSGEIVRQIRHLLGPQNVAFTALSLTSELRQDVFSGVTPISPSGYLPQVLADAVSQSHGVIACEGSMFKSTFSDVLSAVMAGTLGAARRGGKLAIGYGGEVAAMNAGLASFVSSQLGDALILCRSAGSQEYAESLGIRAKMGADTAWTFRASSRERACLLLKGLGWDGTSAVLAVCPSNPFWWPIRANPAMALELKRTGEHSELHYGSVFFHADSHEIRNRYWHYIEQLGFAVKSLCKSKGAFPIFIAMEQMDKLACADLASHCGEVPIVASSDWSLADAIGMLRASQFLVSSRFHALVGAMPAAVPSVGIAMDERVRNLFSEGGLQNRMIPADDLNLGARVVEIIERTDREDFARAANRIVAAGIKGIGTMGMEFMSELKKKLPSYPVASIGNDWRSHVPPLEKDLERFLYQN
jgi:polysaccharide pyruvyl transferase WcaK-like protein